MNCQSFSRNLSVFLYAILIANISFAFAGGRGIAMSGIRGAPMGGGFRAASMGGVHGPAVVGGFAGGGFGGFRGVGFGAGGFPGGMGGFRSAAFNAGGFHNPALGGGEFRSSGIGEFHPSTWGAGGFPMGGTSRFPNSKWGANRSYGMNGFHGFNNLSLSGGHGFSPGAYNTRSFGGNFVRTPRSLGRTQVGSAQAFNRLTFARNNNLTAARAFNTRAFPQNFRTAGLRNANLIGPNRLSSLRSTWVAPVVAPVPVYGYCPNYHYHSYAFYGYYGYPFFGPYYPYYPFFNPYYPFPGPFYPHMPYTYYSCYFDDPYAPYWYGYSNCYGVPAVTIRMSALYVY